MPLFQRYIGIDYSGGGTPLKRNSGIQVYIADRNIIQPQPPPANPAWNWTREELCEWLRGVLAEDTRTIVGIDHAFAYPVSYFQQYGLTTWDDFLAFFDKTFQTREQKVESIRRDINPADPENELRLTEQWTSSAKSVFDFGPNGVAFSTAAGLPWLYDLRRDLGAKVHWWPFDGWLPPAGKSVVCEVYPAIFNKRYPLTDARSPHARDAHAVAAWMQDWDGRSLLHHYFQPPLSPVEQDVASLEGWILGIG
jgi:hypothetical protein